MAVNQLLIRKPSDRGLYIVAAILFPLLVLIGYSRTYYFSYFFDAKPLANGLVHLHGIVMSLWVVYFTAQILLVRTKNVRLHMSMGLAGIALATLVVCVGLATAYDSHIVRHTAPPGLDPYTFFAIPVVDMALFIILFTAAIVYRKKPTEHKCLMLLTALVFVGAAIARIPLVPPQYMLFWTFGMVDLMALAALGWHTWKHGKLNRVFALGTVLVIVSEPFRIVLSGSSVWLRFCAWLAGS